MLTRYQIVRGVPASRLPKGVRQDTRKHTRHVVRPSAELVTEFLEAPSEAAWKKFSSRYRAVLEERFAENRAPFDEIAELAKTEDVLFGCNCPTQKNPDVTHCHTWLALEFFKEKYPKLEVVMPSRSPSPFGRGSG